MESHHSLTVIVVRYNTTEYVFTSEICLTSLNMADNHFQPCSSSQHLIILVHWNKGNIAADCPEFTFRKVESILRGRRPKRSTFKNAFVFQLSFVCSLIFLNDWGYWSISFSKNKVSNCWVILIVAIESGCCTTLKRGCQLATANYVERIHTCWQVRQQFFTHKWIASLKSK